MWQAAGFEPARPVLEGAIAIHTGRRPRGASTNSATPAIILNQIRKFLLCLAVITATVSVRLERLFATTPYRLRHANNFPQFCGRIGLENLGIVKGLNPF